jgi:RimJ/RimL family protein N-acetyltransferase
MRDLGRLVEGWVPPERALPPVLEGASVRLERLGAAHVAALHAANSVDDAIWDYLPYGPFATEADYDSWVAGVAGRDDPAFYALIDLESGRPGGVASLMRNNREAGSIEVGHICLSPGLQKTRAASEMIYLLADRVFGASYRRFEWKCNALNARSRRAAERFGFSFEGVFRNHLVVKGRNRDTAWFAMTVEDWAALREPWATWLEAANFDADGRQRRSLAGLTAPCLVARDPGIAG